MPPYTTGMSDSFNPNQKRGQPNNRGSWVAGDNSLPDDVMPPFDATLVRDTLRQAVAAQRTADKTVHETAARGIAGIMLSRFPDAKYLELDRTEGDWFFPTLVGDRDDVALPEATSFAQTDDTLRDCLLSLPVTPPDTVVNGPDGTEQYVRTPYPWFDYDGTGDITVDLEAIRDHFAAADAAASADDDE